MMVGDSQTSKTLLLNVLELIIGRHNVTQLRTWMLKERFEIGRFEGKTLLAAKDVAGNFLQYSSAAIIKSLVGHDYIPGEIKGSMDEVPIFGDYDLAITSNEALCVSVMGPHDRNAWRRRMIIINFLKRVEKRIVNLDQTLVADEGPGILAFAVTGAMKHMAELDECGDFKQTDTQTIRVDKLLEESDSARFFIRRCVYRKQGADLTSEEITEAYNNYCEMLGWRANPVDVFKRHLPNLMMEILGVQKNTHAERGEGANKTRRNSYANVALAEPDDPKAFAPEFDMK
jgi:phage/plasmid-associated DNA primase